jgi:hypothetical protein
MEKIILSAVIAMLIYIVFLNQCTELDRYGFKVIGEGFKAVKDTFVAGWDPVRRGFKVAGWDPVRRGFKVAGENFGIDKSRQENAKDKTKNQRRRL